MNLQRQAWVLSYFAVCPSTDICSHCHAFKMRHPESTFFTLQEMLKQHFILILLPWNTFCRGEFNIFFALCATMMDYLDCRSQC